MESDEFQKQVQDLHNSIEDLGVTKTYNKEFLTLTLSDSQCIYVFNVKTYEIEHIRNLDIVLGYDASEFTIEKYMNLIHPDDRDIYGRLSVAALKFTIDNPPSETGAFYVTFRMLHKNGHYVKVMRQGFPYQIGTDGAMLSNFSLITDISFMNVSDKVRWELKNYNLNAVQFNDYVKREYKDLFSNREVELILLLKEGFNSREIADKLNLSKHTIDTHRRNMLKKINALSTMEVINYYENYIA